MLSREYYRDLGRALKAKGSHAVERSLKEGLAEKTIKPSDFNLQKLFEAVVPDGAEAMRLARDGAPPAVSLMEGGDAVSMGDFTMITRNIVQTEMLNAMENEEYVFTSLIPTKPARQRYGEVSSRIGSFGDDVEVVFEKDEYPELGLGEDWIHTPPPIKRGGKISVTWELSIFDQTGMVLEAARKIGDSIAYNKEIRAIDCVIDENRTEHRYRYKDNAPIATYNDNTGTHTWDNLAGTNALVDWTDLDNAEQLLNTIVDPLSGRPVVTEATDFIATKQMQGVANYIMTATQLHVHPAGYATSGLTSMSVMDNAYRGKYRQITSRLLALRMATDTSWFIGSIAKAFAYMEVAAAQVFQAPPNSHREFNNDIIAQYKVREMGAYATVEPRYMVKSTAA